MHLIEHVELTEKAAELASDLAEGHYSMSEAIQMIRQLASAHKSMVTNLLDLQKAAVAAHSLTIVDPLPLIAGSILNVSSDAPGDLDDSAEAWQRAVAFDEDALRASRQASRAIEATLRIAARDLDFDDDLEPTSPRM